MHWQRDACRTFAGRSICAECVSRGTFTLVAPFCVQAGSSLTKQWVSLTLIDVCEAKDSRTQRKSKGKATLCSVSKLSERGSSVPMQFFIIMKPLS